MSTNPLHGARVQRGVSLHDIARSTRLSPRIVTALDSGRFEQLPAGIYARSYVRAFARAVELDAEHVLAMLADRLPAAVDLSREVIDRLRPRERTTSAATAIVRDAMMDAAFLVGVSALLVALVSGYCGLPSRTLLRLAPGPMVGLCAPVWVLYELLLGRIYAQRIFWSGNSVLIPWSIGILSACGVNPRPFIRRVSSPFSSVSFAAAAGSLMRLARSPGSFFRS